MFNLLDIQADWITASFPIIRIVLFFIIVLCAIGLIVVTLLQSDTSNQNSMDILSGTRESYYSQNKGASRDGRLKKFTIIFASVLAVCIILYFISLIINNPL